MYTLCSVCMLSVGDHSFEEKWVIGRCNTPASDLLAPSRLAIDLQQPPSKSYKWSFQPHLNLYTKDDAWYHNCDACATIQGHVGNTSVAILLEEWNPQAEIFEPKWNTQVVENLISTLVLICVCRNMRAVTNRRQMKHRMGKVTIGPIIGFRPQNTWTSDERTQKDDHYIEHSVSVDFLDQ